MDQTIGKPKHGRARPRMCYKRGPFFSNLKTGEISKILRLQNYIWMAQFVRAPPSAATTIWFYPKLVFDNTRTRMAMNPSNATASLNNKNINRKLPILLFDIMDTIVRDPFYHDIPAFFGMSFKELIDCKHPTAWAEFENGLIDEALSALPVLEPEFESAVDSQAWLFPEYLAQQVYSLIPKEELEGKFFKDGRPFDLQGLKDCMRRGYSYIGGVEQLLQALKQNNYEMHAFTNYPIWYKIIEDKLNISKYLSWTFCSCAYGKRKPDPDFYLAVVEHLKVDPASCIFIDDRIKNVEAAIGVGITGLQFKNADLLRQDLLQLGVDISIDGQ